MADLAALGFSVDTAPLEKGTASLDKLAGSAAKAEKATDGVGAASERAGQRMGSGSKAVERLLQAIEKVERAVREQNAAMGQMGGAMARAEAQMEAASNAAQSVASAVTQASAASNAASAGIAKAGSAAQAANQNFENMNRAASAAAATLQRVNSATGVSLPMAGAERAEDIAAYGRALDDVRAKYNPLFAISQQYTKSVAEIREAHRMGAISAAEMSDAIANAGNVASAQQVAMLKLRSNLGDVEGAARLTGNQMLNLSRQANDALTMWFSGSGLGQIIATQAGQVFGALEEGPRGLRGSLEAIGTAFMSLLTPMNLAIAGFAALGAGAIYFGMRGREKVVPLTDAMKAHQDAVGDVASAYGAAATEAANFQKVASGVAAFNLRQSRAQLEFSARSTLRDAFAPGLMDAITGDQIFGGRIGGQGRAAVRITEQFREFEQPLMTLLDGLANGTARADLFVDAIAEIANLDPANAELQKAAKRLIEMAGAAADAQRQLQGLGTAFSRFAQQTKQFNELAGSLGEFIPNRLTSEQQIEQTYQQMMRLAKTEADITRAQDLRRLSLEGLSEVEARRRDSYDLDVRAITARSAAERAQIEYERTYADVLASTNNKAQAARQAEEARNLTLKQASFDQAEAVRQRTEAGRQQVEQLQQELETFGRSAGEIARLRAETEMLTAAREAARQAGTIVDPAEEAAIRSQAADIGRLTDQMARLGMDRDQGERLRQLQAETGLIGLNDDARRVALAGLEAESELRRAGIPLNDAWGQSYVANARQLATLENALDKQQEAFSELKDAASSFFEALSSGEGIMDALANAFGRFGQQLAAKGFDKLFGSLFGSGGEGATSIAQIGSRAVSAANQNVPQNAPALSTERTFSAPVAAVERRVLPALSNFSTELTAAAKAIRTIESGSAGGNYSAMGPVTRNGDRAYGAYQVMGNNIADWSRSAIGREVSKMEFLRSVELQDKIFEHRFGGYMAKYGAEGASRAWFAGEGGMKNWSAKDVVGTSVSGYGSRFGQLFAQHSGGASSATTRAYERATERGVERGLTNVLPSIDGGYAGYGRTGAIPTPTANPGQSGGGGLFSNLFGGQGGGMIGAGLGSFFSGYQSGSPISGALGGLMAGASLGPPGMIIGALAGALGGGLGGRAQRKQAHEQAAAEWAANRPAYESFKRSLTGSTGTLRGQFGGEWSQFQQFVSSGSKAWKNGSGNSTAEFDSTGLLIMNRAIKAMTEFRQSFDQMLVDVAKGLGSNSPFTKGTEAVKTMREQYMSALDDVEVAFGKADNGLPLTGELIAWEAQLREERERAVEAFKKASIENALGLLSIVEPMSEVAQALDGYRGIAERMTPVLVEMGLAAEEAGRAVNDRFNSVLAKLRSTFEEGVNDRLLSLQGKGYVTEAREMLKEFAQLQADASLLGADQSNFGELLRLQAQAIVDGAELTGDAFSELVRMFPQLSGVVREFSATAQQTAKEVAQANLDAARSVLDRSYQAEVDRINDLLTARRQEASELQSTVSRLKDFTDQLAEFKKSLLVDDALSTLSPEKRLEEARKQFLDLAAKARAGDEDAQAQLTGAGQEYLTEARSYYASTQRYHEAFDEVRQILDQSETAARSQLTTAESQLRALERQITQNEALLETNRKEYEALLGINEGIKSLSVAMAEYASAVQAAVAQGIKVPGSAGNAGGSGDGTGRNNGWTGGSASSYLQQNPDVAKAIAGGNTFGLPAGMSPEVYASAHYGLFGNGEGRKFASGGYTGPGGVNEVAGTVHRGEVVWSQRDVSAWGGPSVVDSMRMSRRLPMVAAPVMPRVSNDNGNIVAAIEDLKGAVFQSAKAQSEHRAAIAQEDRRERRDETAETERRRESTGRIAARRAHLAA